MNITTIIEQMNAGYTQPMLVQCDDSKQYIMKCINTTTNGKALFNELFASRFANLIDLETPTTHIARLPQSLIQDNTVLINNGSIHGDCFVSEYENGSAPGINPIIAKSISNIKIFPLITFFDALVMNVDRADNKGNWFVTKNNQSLIALDHTNIFRLAQIWNKASLEQDTSVPPFMVDELNNNAYLILSDMYKHQFPDSHQPFGHVARKIKSLTPAQIDSCFEGVPNNWNISDIDLKAASDFIHFQINHADDILNELEHKFKFNDKGGRNHGK